MRPVASLEAAHPSALPSYWRRRAFGERDEGERFAQDDRITDMVGQDQHQPGGQERAGKIGETRMSADELSIEGVGVIQVERGG